MLDTTYTIRDTDMTEENAFFRTAARATDGQSALISKLGKILRWSLSKTVHADFFIEVLSETIAKHWPPRL